MTKIDTDPKGSVRAANEYKATRGRVLPQNQPYYVHVMSRVVNRSFILGRAEKAKFRALMRSQAAYSGLEIVTYVIMDNHFHILLKVPQCEELGHEEVAQRIEHAHGRLAAADYRQRIERFHQRGQFAAADAERERHLARMYDLAAYMQQLKRLFTRWYNTRNHRKGTLWESRYNSVVVEGCGNPLLTMAAYIDLNPVRAGLVDDPKDYHFGGYGEAVGGCNLARAGLTVICTLLGRSTDWRMVQRTYRIVLFGKGEQPDPLHGRKGFDRERVREVWEADGVLTLQELLRCRVRYFSDTVAIGSRAYVESMFDSHRTYFSEKRRSGARALSGPGLQHLCGLRDLKVNVVG